MISPISPPIPNLDPNSGNQAYLTNPNTPPPKKRKEKAILDKMFATLGKDRRLKHIADTNPVSKEAHVKNDFENEIRHVWVQT